MHSHDHDLPLPHDEPRVTPRQDAGGPSAAAQALAAGRLDAVQPQGVLQLQRLAGNQRVGAALAEREQEQEQESPVQQVLASGGGQPLDAGTRADMEARFGADFGDVRLHTDAAASASAEAVSAHAYTVGSDIVFQRGHYAPDTEAGRRTLAHELTHVVQQRSGPVDGAPAPGGIRVSDPSDRFEREAVANADRVLAAPAPGVQREAEEDEQLDERQS
jgi:hypothetical protein